MKKEQFVTLIAQSFRAFLAVLGKHFLHTFSLIMESQTAQDHMG